MALRSREQAPNAGGLRLRGTEGIIKTLKELPAEVVSKRGGPVREALYQGAKIFRIEAKATVPRVIKHPERSTGALQRSIIATRGRVPVGFSGERYIVWLGKPKLKVYVPKSRSGKRGNKIYFAPGPTYYGRFVEYGRKHKTKSGEKQVTPTPYMRPAFNAKQSLAVATINRELAARVQKLAEKNFKKNKTA
ncbi:MAG: HK97 gp10 family phage protein [Gammaproteobacteria bacterium]